MADKTWQTDVRQEDYEAIEQAVLESARGRWFLAEFARRNRAADTRLVLEAMGRLEKVVVNRLPVAADPQPVALDLDKARSEIVAARHEMLDGEGALAPGSDPFRAVATASADTLTNLSAATETLQTLASGLRQRHPEDPALEQLDSTIGKLSRERWKSELNLRRVRSAMAVLSNAAARRNAASPSSSPGPSQPAIDPRNLNYFPADEDLFQPIPLPAKPRMSAVVDAIATSEAFHFHAEEARPEAPTAVTAADQAAERKKRIVVVRASSGDIPLAPELAPEAADTPVKAGG
jgi:hypothetical protein